MKVKQKKCKICKNPFTPRNSSLQIVCGYQCAITYARNQEEKKEAQKAKEQRQRTKEKKEELKTIQELINETQIVFNTFIRLRDKGKPCISCGRPDNGSRNASHYYNANNHWNLRFDLNNVHASCIECNKSKHGNLIEYRKRLVVLFGEEYVKDLDDRAHVTRKFSREEVREIKKEFKERIKSLK